jgi:hypothetical protein
VWAGKHKKEIGELDTLGVFVRHDLLINGFKIFSGSETFFLDCM